ncbi:phospholipase D-like domain-containing protein [Salinigranum rubrum]|uniref:hypothetical protein n=1 Tax=Salinigranum rubrum TaxID=755307 RepID=UPI0013A5567D|nr:hypothetical protein [Salinigranum rubrum]
MLLPSGPGISPNYGQEIFETISEFDQPINAGVAFPFVTTDGLDNYCYNNSGDDWREICDSQWIIGLNQGITTPNALEELLSKSRTDVRLFLPRGEVTEQALRRGPYLHAKVGGFYSESTKDQICLFVTSANATGAAMSSHPKNFEMGSKLSYPDRIGADDIRIFRQWWEEVSSNTVTLTEDLIRDYESVRSNVPTSPPEAEQSDVQRITTSSDAKYMWTETGAMQGQMRYILEIKEELADFFEEKTPSDSYITIEFRGNRESRKLTYHEGHYSPQWRVFLPTNFPAHNEDFYRYKVALFEERFTDNGSRYYRLQIRNRNHTDVESWRQQAIQNGVNDETGGGGDSREYGYW